MGERIGAFECGESKYDVYFGVGLFLLHVLALFV